MKKFATFLGYAVIAGTALFGIAALVMRIKSLCCSCDGDYDCDCDCDDEACGCGCGDEACACSEAGEPCSDDEASADEASAEKE